MKSEKLYPSITPLTIFIALLLLAGTIVGSEAKETVLHHFGSGTDGAAVYGRVISGAGIVFELTNPEAPGGWNETVLYTFSGGSDGSQPYGGLIFDSAGNLYG